MLTAVHCEQPAVDKDLILLRLRKRISLLNHAARRRLVQEIGKVGGYIVQLASAGAQQRSDVPICVFSRVTDAVCVCVCV